MKRYLPFLLFLGTFYLAPAQTQRTVLVEHFTQASCPPCATINPPFFALLEQNTDKAIWISYQVSWPGYDPMYEHNPLQVNQRVDYYSVNAVPNTVMDGTGPGSTNSLVTQASINNRYNTPSPFSISLEHEISPVFDEVSMTMTITAEQDVSGPMVAHMAVVEENIHFNFPPGSNGEKDFHGVMKRMLPDANGTSLPDNWTAGQQETITASWKLENVYDLREVGVIAWVQNTGNKEVLQSHFSHPDLQAAGPNDALISQAAASGNLSVSRMCGESASPVVELMNAGSDFLHSATIDYRINGGSWASYSWTGSLAYLQRTLVDLPAISFSPQAVNQLDVTVRSPNGSMDDNESNDQFSSEFYPAITTGTSPIVQVRPANAPGSVSWEVIDDNSNVVASGGPYSSPFLTQQHPLTLEDQSCYKLRVTNNSSGFNGFLQLMDGGEELVKVDLNGNVNSTTEFGTYSFVGTDNIVLANSLKIAPNPVSEQLTINLEVLSVTDLDLRIVNQIGQTVRKSGHQLNEGTNVIVVNEVAELAPGIYFLELSLPGHERISRKFIKN